MISLTPRRPRSAAATRGSWRRETSPDGRLPGAARATPALIGHGQIDPGVPGEFVDKGLDLVQTVGSHEDPANAAQAARLPKLADRRSDSHDVRVSGHLTPVGLGDVGPAGGRHAAVPVAETEVVPDDPRRRRQDVHQPPIGAGHERGPDTVAHVQQLAQGKPQKRGLPGTAGGGQAVDEGRSMSVGLNDLAQTAHFARDVRTPEVHLGLEMSPLAVPDHAGGDVSEK